MNDALLEIIGATKRYPAHDGSGATPTVLDNFNLVIPAGEARIVTIAGESGSGKSTLASAILGLVPLTEGKIMFKGRDISRLGRVDRKKFRRYVQAVFQDPYGTFNPFYRVSHTFDTVIRNFRLARQRHDAQALIEEALSVVSLNAAEVLHKYPHQLSGGQRQRIMMARAYLLKPDLIVADEPVSMIDASLRSMILRIMQRMRDEHGISFLYITHDLATAHQIADETFLMYRGVTVEHGMGSTVLSRPQHPYSQQLVASIPRIDQKWDGTVELPDELPPTPGAAHGCLFTDRCPVAVEACTRTVPKLLPVGAGGHEAACLLYERQASA
ncbi:ABC transporter ATP-binding protein [Embleya scabrispora]|uniref:ABC transporter ATP-binding protein n=1 Tax=Embleya scabrispora TaxID=159449 RepID=UPI00037C0C71|nr:ABC transporter ATP-binding protein [Embleya scabrispora]MYS85108.1 ATP-binding cassette domain-containing protein [Streptomyces sp. SID5474]